MASHSGGVCSESERRLYDFITRSLQPHASASLPYMSEELERNLLISLSSVSREIERWTNEEMTSSYSEQVGEERRVLDNCRTCSINSPIEDDSVSLASVVSSLMILLRSESLYARHLVADTLVAVFKFLIESESNWEDFVCLLWTSLKEPISSLALQLQSPPLALADKGFMSNCLPIRHGKSELMQGDDLVNVNPVASLKSNSQSLRFHMAINLTGVLRIISKDIKLNHNNIMEVYVRLAVDSLLRIPWELLSNIQNAGSMINSSDEGWLDEEISHPKLRYIFLGALLQLFCSLVDQEHVEEAYWFDDSILYSKFTFLVQQLLTCCLSYNMEHKSTSISRYLRHKALMLMIRISSWSQWNCSIAMLWLNLLKEYFKDLLYQHISICHAKHTSSVEGSPFQVIAIGGEHADLLCTCHIQRQTYLLFLKCCIKLVHLNNESFKGCGVATGTFSMPQAQLMCRHFHSNGLSELLEWLDRQVSLGEYHIDVEGHSYSISCSRFAFAFLQLFLDEDDMLFWILLQLLDTPFSAMHQQNSGNSLPSTMDRDKVIDISNMFSPIPIFHLFLSLLHYDHSVLLDYLISKDTGILCVKYLLSSISVQHLASFHPVLHDIHQKSIPLLWCLRMVCQSWHDFEECLFSNCEIAQPSSKRSKTSAVSDGSTRGHGGRQVGKRCEARWAIKDSKDCLLSLKTSIDDLHKKNLFPYNPSALLRSCAINKRTSPKIAASSVHTGVMDDFVALLGNEIGAFQRIAEMWPPVHVNTYHDCVTYCVEICCLCTLAVLVHEWFSIFRTLNAAYPCHQVLVTDSLTTLRNFTVEECRMIVEKLQVAAKSSRVFR